MADLRHANIKPVKTLPAVRLVAKHSPNHAENPPLATSLVCSLAPALMAVAFPLAFAAGLTTAALVAMAVAGVASAVTFSLVGRMAPRVRPFLPVVVAAVFVVCGALVLAIPDARAGLFAFVNTFIAAHNETYRTYMVLVSNGAMVCGSLVFAVCMGVLVGMAAWFITHLRHTGVALVLIVGGGVISLLMGLGYSGPAVVIGLGAWLVQCRFTQLSDASYSPQYLLGIASGLFTLCIALFAACGLLYSPSQAIGDAYQSFHQSIIQARYGSDSLPQGDLSQAPSMNSGASDALELTVDGRISDDLMLRGYVGANFNGDVWQALDYSAYEGDWKGMFGWMSNEGLMAVQQRAAFDDEQVAAGRADAAEVATVSVDASNAYRRYLYVPYTLRDVDGAHALTFDGFVPNGVFPSSTYRYTIDNVPANEVLADAQFLDGTSDGYAKAEAVYAAFAKEHYLDVPDVEAEAVREYVFNPETWDETAATSEYSVISRVRTMLDTLASYSENVGAPAGDASFTEWFLGQTREGNSAYFATVATLAFREQGIPARYVEGYRAESADISAANAAGEPVRLGARDAHAWVEIYLEGIGWTPIEVTPGFYTQSLNVDSVIDVGESWSNGSQEVAMQGESVAGQVDEDEQPNRIELPLVPIILSVLAIAVLVLVALVAMAFVQRIVRRRYGKGLVESDDQAVCIPALYHFFSVIMGNARCGFSAERPLECVDRFAVAFPGIDEQEYKRFIELHQAYAFGGRLLKPNELRTLRRFNMRVYDALPEPQTALERAKRYFIDAL